jgi:hypothetical protein
MTTRATRVESVEEVEPADQDGRAEQSSRPIKTGELSSAELSKASEPRCRRRRQQLRAT